jgi:uncharacterized protein (DUF1697 family)
MSRYVAFLRAINVGGRTVPMTVLRKHFEALGCSSVDTVVASGNIVFESVAKSAAALETRVAAHLERRLGYPVATFLRTPEELGRIVAHRPFDRAEIEAAHALFVGFLGREADAAARRRVQALASDLDAFRFRGRDVYWLARERVSDSKVYGGGLERALGQAATLRNIKTVRKIAERLA